MKKIPGNIIISRTDSIGDVVLTLPVAAILKKHFPDMIIAFMGRSYTRPVIEACRYVDEFIDVEDFFQQPVTIRNQRLQAILHVFPTYKIALRAKQLLIPLRIGTTNRWYHWISCNKLIPVSRKNSLLHEAQLNIQLLKPFGLDTNYSLQQIEALFGMELLAPLQKEFSQLIDASRYNLILHPKSQGSAREWPLTHYIQLIKILNPKKYKLFISGTLKERELLLALFDEVGPLVMDITGAMPLSQFISFIKHCDGMVAASTGPIHLAAVSGRDAIGIYPPIRPSHPGRWKPVGPKVKVFVEPKECEECRNNTHSCACMSKITPELIKKYLDNVVASRQQ